MIGVDPELLKRMEAIEALIDRVYWDKTNPVPTTAYYDVVAARERWKAAVKKLKEKGT